jgi:aromatic ring hydroxylase
MEASIMSGLASLGAAGAVIIALFYYMKHESERDKLRTEGDQRVLDRIDKIVDRHLASEELNRQQIRELSEANRALFDRVIGICTDLSIAVKELRAEFHSLGGLPPARALGHEDPRPLPPG